MSKVYDRQWPLSAVADMGIAQMGAGNEMTIKLPVNALLMRLLVVTVTAFDSVTTATATVSDGTTTFASAVDIKTAGSETVSNAPKFYPTGGTLTCSLAQTGGDATVGRVLVIPEYVVVGRGNEIGE